MPLQCLSKMDSGWKQSSIAEWGIKEILFGSSQDAPVLVTNDRVVCHLNEKTSQSLGLAGLLFVSCYVRISYIVCA